MHWKMHQIARKTVGSTVSLGILKSDTSVVESEMTCHLNSPKWMVAEGHRKGMFC